LQACFVWPGPSEFSGERMSEKIFQWLLRLYPRRFRGEYGGAMRQLFRDRLVAETGFLGRLRLWMDLLQEFAMSVRREHRRRTQVAAAECGGYRNLKRRSPKWSAVTSTSIR
jgi:hypothetical protein